MELSEQEKREAMKRLLLSRMRILNNHGFYGLLLMLDGNNTSLSFMGAKEHICPSIILSRR